MTASFILVGGFSELHAQTCGVVETSFHITPPSGATTIPGGSGIDFGSSIAVSGDRVVVGAREFTGSGKGFATVYRTDMYPWTIEATSLQANNGASNDRFGYDVAIDGDVLVSGAPFHAVGASDSAGAAYVFTFSGSAWSTPEILLAPDVQELARFGHSVAVAGDLIAVGTPRENSGTIQNPIVASGAVHVFQFGGSTWTHVRTFTAPTNVAQDQFGFAIAMENTTLVVGAPRRKEGSDPNDSGAVFVYDLSDPLPANWSLTTTLQAPDPLVKQQLGYAVAIHGDVIAAGAPFDSIGPEGCPELASSSGDPEIGAVHMFRLVGSSWIHEERVTFPLGHCGSVLQFGKTIALTDDRVLVGSPHELSSPDVNYDAFLFTYSSTNWHFTQRLTPASSGQHVFGSAVGFADSGTPIVGARMWINSQSEVVGRVHAFSTPFLDCNGNGIDDCMEILMCMALDCNGNGIPDCCDIVGQNGQPPYSQDLNGNGIPDECEAKLNCGIEGSEWDDCNNNRVPDDCERSGRYDIVFVIDLSGSIGEVNFNAQLEAIAEVVCEDTNYLLPSLIEANGKVRIAVVVFNQVHVSLTCENYFVRIPLTTINSSPTGPTPSMTPAEFCAAVTSIDHNPTGQFTVLSGGLDCALQMLEDVSGYAPYRREVIIVGDGGLNVTDSPASIAIADQMRNLSATTINDPGLSARVSYVQLNASCGTPSEPAPLKARLTNHASSPDYRPCLPRGLIECGWGMLEPVDAVDRIYDGFSRIIIQNLLRCPGSPQDLDICNLKPEEWDCNGNGIPDCIDILTRNSLDQNEPGVPDECGQCLGDLNGDFGVDIADLLVLLSAWGPCDNPSDCPPDLNGDGVVNINDLLTMFSVWGPCNPGEKVNPCTQQVVPRYEVLPPESIADCIARYSSNTENLIKCIEAMALAGTP